MLMCEYNFVTKNWLKTVNCDLLSNNKSKDNCSLGSKNTTDQVYTDWYLTTGTGPLAATQVTQANVDNVQFTMTNKQQEKPKKNCCLSFIGCIHDPANVQLTSSN